MLGLLALFIWTISNSSRLDLYGGMYHTRVTGLSFWISMYSQLYKLYIYRKCRGDHARIRVTLHTPGSN